MTASRVDTTACSAVTFRVAGFLGGLIPHLRATCRARVRMAPVKSVYAYGLQALYTLRLAILSVARYPVAVAVGSACAIWAICFQRDQYSCLYSESIQNLARNPTVSSRVFENVSVFVCLPP
jgi:hypothetical protein